MTYARHSKHRNAKQSVATRPPTPPGAMCLISAQFYKIGLRGKVFRWDDDNEQWVRCMNYSVVDLRKAAPLNHGK
jgi:hypothetical protein